MAYKLFWSLSSYAPLSTDTVTISWWIWFLQNFCLFGEKWKEIWRKEWNITPLYWRIKEFYQFIIYQISMSIKPQSPLFKHKLWRYRWQEILKYMVVTNVPYVLQKCEKNLLYYLFHLLTWPWYTHLKIYWFT